MIYAILSAFLSTKYITIAILSLPYILTALYNECFTNSTVILMLFHICNIILFNIVYAIIFVLYNLDIMYHMISVINLFLVYLLYLQLARSPPRSTGD